MRAPGMQVLTDQIKTKKPGVTIYGIGDDDHKDHTSGHNEDDTPGVKAEDQDSDSTPEHRAIDVMVGSSFSSSDADRLVNDLVSNSANRARMLYVNWGTTQWARSNGWAPRDNSDDPHEHVHISGEADADSNTSPWVLSDWDNTTGEDMSWEQELTAGQDAGGGTYKAQDWLIGANWKAWDSYNNTEIIKTQLDELTLLIRQLLEMVRDGGVDVDVDAFLTEMGTRLSQHAENVRAAVAEAKTQPPQ